MDFTRIHYLADDRRAVITLNRPEKRNALDDIMVRELTDALMKAARDPDVRVVILRANGSAFCAGADLEYLQRVASYDHEQNRDDSSRLAQLFRIIYEMRKPVIARVTGAALAGGCGLATVCDFILAADGATFGYTEVRIGFIPAIVMSFLKKRIGEGRARELVLRGNIITAREAAQIGLITEAIPEKELDARVTALADGLINDNSATAMSLCKEMLAKLDGMAASESLDFAAAMNAAARMTPDCKRGIAAFLTKEKITW